MTKAKQTWRSPTALAIGGGFAIALLAILFGIPSGTKSTALWYNVQKFFVQRTGTDYSSTESRTSNNSFALKAKNYVFCSHNSQASSVYTGEIDAQGNAAVHECLAVTNNRVAKVGSADALRAWCASHDESSRERCTIHYLTADQTIVPGLHDAHGHVLDLGWSRTAVDLVGAQSHQDVVKRIEKYIKERPDLLNNKSIWIQGIGWDQTKWTPSTFPLAEDLDASSLLKGRKIMLRRIDVHALWLSRAALDAIEESGHMPLPTKDDTEIEGGLIIRDENTKRPSGCLIDNAMGLAYKVIPPWTEEDRTRYLETAAKELLSVGITSVGDAAVDLESIDFYMRRRNTLPIRIYALMACPPGHARCADLAVARGLPVIAKPFSSERLTVRAVKLFADGALGSWGSAMWTAYDDKPGWRGLMLIDEQDVYALIHYWTLAGWNVATHCIGDRAQSITLDAYERLLYEERLTTSDEARFRIEHAQIVRAQDIQRFGTAGVIASVQPTHCTSDMAYVEQRIGAERARGGAYAWQSFAQVNATLALGSDFPVELPSPIHGFYAAVTRMDSNQSSPFGKYLPWYGEQRLTRAQALHGFTAAPAFAQFEESTGGTLTAGKRADFVVLDQDLIRQEDLNKLHQTNVMATYIDGKMVWKRE